MNGLLGAINSIPELIPKIATGFSLCAFIAWMVATTIKARIKKDIELINAAPEADRLKQTKVVLDGMDIDTAVLPPDKIFKLAQTVLNNRITKLKIVATTSIIICSLGAVAALAAFKINHDGKIPGPKDQVNSIKADILAAKGDYEGLVPLGKTNSAYESLARKVEVECKQLADRMLNIHDSILTRNYQIHKYEYATPALYMSAFAASDPSNKIADSEKAIECADKSLLLLAELKDKAAQGDPEASSDYAWFVQDHVPERIRDYRAVALAINAKSNGRHKASEVVTTLNEINEINPQYLRDFPPDSNPYLKWAISENSVEARKP